MLIHISPPEIMAFKTLRSKPGIGMNSKSALTMDEFETRVAK